MGKKILAGAGLGAVCVDALYRYIFCRNLGPMGAIFPGRAHHDEGYYALRDGTAAALREKKPCLRYSMVNKYGLELRGFYYPCGEKPGKKIAFIVHGYRSEHAETAGMFYEYYHSRGFDVFACDHGAAGVSQGQIIGYDVLESEDCLRWIDFLKEEFGGDIQIILHGFSMGGATVLKMSDRVPDNVKFIISDSGFSDARGLIECNIGPLYHLMRLVNFAVGRYDINAADVRQNVKNSSVPILFVHGELDPTVPFAMGKELYELCTVEKDCLFTPDAKHIENMYRHPREYAEKMDAFIGKYVILISD